MGHQQAGCTHPQHVLQCTHAMQAMRAWCSAHADEPCSLRLSLGQADLLATLPGRYPGAAGQPAQVVVASASLSRVQAAELSQQLQQQADAAATTVSVPPCPALVPALSTARGA